jgi:hypothetical protein
MRYVSDSTKRNLNAEVVIIARRVWLNADQAKVLPTVIERAAKGLGKTKRELVKLALSNFDLAQYLGKVCREVASTKGEA